MDPRSAASNTAKLQYACSGSARVVGVNAGEVAPLLLGLVAEVDADADAALKPPLEEGSGRRVAMAEPSRAGRGGAGRIGRQRR